MYIGWKMISMMDNVKIPDEELRDLHTSEAEDQSVSPYKNYNLENIVNSGMHIADLLDD